MATFQEAFNQWKEKKAADNRLFGIKFYCATTDTWTSDRGTYFGLKAANLSAAKKSTEQSDFLFGTSYKGEMYALFSEGKRIWEKEDA